MKRLSSLLLCSAACLTSVWGQTLTSIEAVEYEPNSDRWVVSNGSSMLVTADEGMTWSTFGSGGATHGMEVVGSTLFAIQNNVLRAYDVVTESQIGSVIPIGVTFLNGMGSYSNDEGDFLVVSDFGTGRILKVDVTDPTDMQVSTLVGNTGTTPNGVTVVDQTAYVVNWGGNASVLAIDVETGEQSTVLGNSGLGNCDGVDHVWGSFVVSSWSPQRLSLFTMDDEGAWSEGETLVQGSPLSNPADLSINTAGDTYAVACSGNNTVYFGNLMDWNDVTEWAAPFETHAAWAGGQLELAQAQDGQWTLRGFDMQGRQLGSHQVTLAQGTTRLSRSDIGTWLERAPLVEATFQPQVAHAGTFRTTLKQTVVR